MSTQHLILYVLIPSEHTNEDGVHQETEMKTVEVKTANIISNSESNTNCNMQSDMNFLNDTQKFSPHIRSLISIPSVHFNTICKFAQVIVNQPFQYHRHALYKLIISGPLIIYHSHNCCYSAFLLCKM